LYPGHAFAQTHPDRLATLATLFGMTPAAIVSCRVLELGCGDGGNLIPIALGLPSSRCVGIDLAPRAISRGQSVVTALGLDNISLKAGDIRAVSGAWGEFDYIISHGLYSWVPPEVQDKVLAICHDNLGPNGVAYVSYNAFPGCWPRQTVREMLLYHTRECTGPDEKIGQARAFAQFLKEAHSKPEPFWVWLRADLERVAEHDGYVLYHDDLAPINVPAYFHQFMERARRHGLQFLAEADYGEMQDHRLPPRVAEQLRRLAGGDILKKEQYLDFSKGRRFRQTLLCHAGVKLNRAVQPERLAGFHVASPACPMGEELDLWSTSNEEFRGRKDAALTTDYPLAKAALCLLGRVYPLALSFANLVARSRALIGRAPPPTAQGLAEDETVLAGILLQAYGVGLIELYREPARFTLQAGPRPMVSPLARWQIANGDRWITNLRHNNLPLIEPFDRALISLLDGTRDRGALLADLAGLVESGAAPLVDGDSPITDPQEIRHLLASGLEISLAQVGRLALLVC
jgi:methyltransferase-like protein/SAM-dependent methyltransferase